MRFDPRLEQWRAQLKGHPTTQRGDEFGRFLIPFRTTVLNVIAVGALPPVFEWEHVSVSLSNRCPNWDEMCHVKALFWGAEETVLQFHPRASEYVNLHPYVLHLWRKVGVEPELPPRICV